MWRAFFLASGITLILLGAQFLVVERVVLAYGKPAAATEQSGYFFNRNQAASAPRHKEIAPPDWAPWGLMAAGAVVMIYSFTIPKRAAQ